jgi:flagellar biosynthesis protein FlhB
MAENDADKSQEATAHRRQQAREQGQVVQSRDLGSAALLVGAIVVLMFLGGPVVEFMGRLGRQQFGGEAWLSADPSFTVQQCHTILFELAKVLLPIFGLFLLLSILADLFQFGFLFLPDKLAPDISRLDPLKGLGRIFSLANLVRLVLGLGKLAVVSAVAYFSLRGKSQEILGLAGLALPQIATYLFDILLWTSLKIAVALLILALLDYLYQWWRHEQDLRMTPQEVREEMRNLQGDPQVASRRRTVQRQLALNRLSGAVPKADVVVTNPTELAVAIQYDPETMKAPIVVAKGAGIIAQRIRRLALENDVPIVERKPLAQALYKEVEVNHPIPQEMYAAVAEILAYVYQLKGKPLPAAARQAG